MLFLQFTVDSTRYVLATRAIIEVVPLAPLQKQPNAPAHIAGLMNYRGRSLPVIDISQLFAGYDSALRLSSRIVVVKLALPDGAQRTIGLLLEKATEILKLDESQFTEPGFENPHTPYLDKVTMDGQGMLQRVSPENILSAMDAERLFPATGEH
ncbi:MAG TPA: purine-binding chemotaxis protein CheW [Gammaproteobacteria bacterium]|nr:purine-binding chemotaxis protein CheW [Gammaproteobacteria bacterium]